MSDFDDEPTVAADASDDQWDEEPKANRRQRAEPDDDWDDDWDDEDDRGGGGKRDLTLVYAIVAAAIVIVLAVVLTRPKDDNNSNANPSDPNASTTQATLPNKNWQGAVGDAVGENGKNAQARAESGAGVYIWTDFQGWHLRNNGVSEVKVTVTADQVRVKKTDDGDDGDESADTPFSTEQEVTLPAGDGKSGVGLDLGTSEKATFLVVADGKNVDAATIKVGGAQGTAEGNPVTFVKA